MKGKTIGFFICILFICSIFASVRGINDEKGYFNINDESIIISSRIVQDDICQRNILVDSEKTVNNDDYSICLEEPVPGGIYYFNVGIIRIPFFKSAFLYMCYGIDCCATTEGPVEYVVFSFKDKTAIDADPTGHDNSWFANLKGVRIGIVPIYAYAYDDDGNIVASDSRTIYKIGNG